MRLLLLTHLSHRTGLVVPVAEVARMAKARGIDVIVDAAHSWGQIDFNVRDLGVDFVGFNLHKWIGAPVGVGFLYIAKDRLADIDRDKGDEDFAADDVRSRVHTGTVNFATVLAIPAALALHQAIGVKAKGARLRYLRDRWVEPRPLQGDAGDPDAGRARHAWRHHGVPPRRQDARRPTTTPSSRELRDKHKVLTVRRAGVAKGQCIRVSRALYSTEDDVDRLIEALAIVSGTRAG